MNTGNRVGVSENGQRCELYKGVELGVRTGQAGQVLRLLKSDNDTILDF